ncbi:DoxX family protein [Oscillatoria sp. CS-180]|uniref:DoxX family protein n=1 Tax=Oscillatoria sp. CS-180 TaxID=3021720 RepID=UPI00232D26A2|nr:DoxX family protein [Oscillatoria sp. CS-180]MDB9528245.1 DoxX family protein [Oscillatoria sp. CS-180]
MKYLPLIARIALALIFLNAGIKHAIGFSGFVDSIAQVLPLAPVLAIGTIVFQLLGALSLILGYKVSIGATLLVLFLIPATLVFHNPIADTSQLTPFLKNLGLIGGLLMVIYAGAGAVSLDGDTYSAARHPEMSSTKE